MADSGSIAQFMDVTGASQEAAKFFLESSGGVVDAAVDHFFATGGEIQAAGAPEGEVVETDNVLPPGKRHFRHLALLSQWHSYLEPKQCVDDVLMFSFSMQAFVSLSGNSLRCSCQAQLGLM